MRGRRPWGPGQDSEAGTASLLVLLLPSPAVVTEVLLHSGRRCGCTRGNGPGPVAVSPQHPGILCSGCTSGCYFWRLVSCVIISGTMSPGRAVKSQNADANSGESVCFQRKADPRHDPRRLRGHISYSRSDVTVTSHPSEPPGEIRALIPILHGGELRASESRG